MVMHRYYVDPISCINRNNLNMTATCVKAQKIPYTYFRSLRHPWPSVGPEVVRNSPPVPEHRHRWLGHTSPPHPEFCPPHTSGLAQWLSGCQITYKKTYLSGPNWIYQSNLCIPWKPSFCDFTIIQLTKCVTHAEARRSKLYVIMFAYCTPYCIFSFRFWRSVAYL